MLELGPSIPWQQCVDDNFDAHYKPQLFGLTFDRDSLSSNIKPTFFYSLEPTSSYQWPKLPNTQQCHLNAALNSNASHRTDPRNWGNRKDYGNVKFKKQVNESTLSPARSSHYRGYNTRETTNFKVHRDSKQI